MYGDSYPYKRTPEGDKKAEGLPIVEGGLNLAEANKYQKEIEQYANDPRTKSDIEANFYSEKDEEGKDKDKGKPTAKQPA